MTPFATVVSAPEGPVQCPACGWTDGGDLRLEATPVFFELYGMDGEPATTCGGCDGDLWPEDVVAVTGASRRHALALSGDPDAFMDLRHENYEPDTNEGEMD